MTVKMIQDLGKKKKLETKMNNLQETMNKEIEGLNIKQTDVKYSI